MCKISNKKGNLIDFVHVLHFLHFLHFPYLTVKAIVEHNYTAKESDELTLTKGAIIYNIKRQSGGWWEGTLTANGKTGMFPDNFVRVLDSDEKSPVVLR